MKKIFFTIIVSTLLISCKKEPKEIGNKSSSESSTDTTKYETNGVFSIGKPIGKFGNGVTDIDGNKYRTVIIGTQEWMGENLKTTKYNDGTTIPNITNESQWWQNQNWQNQNIGATGAWAYHKNDAANNAKSGKLYNWYAVSKTSTGNKNVCPTGWHVPTDTEWTVLTDYLGGDSVAGSKMKEIGTTRWGSPNDDATNTSLFSANPGGYRTNGGNFVGYYEDEGYLWSSTEDGTYVAWHRYLSSINGRTVRSSYGKGGGLSVRCLRD